MIQSSQCSENKLVLRCRLYRLGRPAGEVGLRLTGLPRQPPPSNGLTAGPQSVQRRVKDGCESTLRLARHQTPETGLPLFLFELEPALPSGSDGIAAFSRRRQRRSGTKSESTPSLTKRMMTSTSTLGIKKGGRRLIDIRAIR